MQRPPARSLRAVVLGVVAAIASACGNQPQIAIQTPVHGSWVTPPRVTGSIRNFPIESAVVEVNGIPATIRPGGTFEIDWQDVVAAIPADRAFHPVVADLINGANDQLVARDRVVVHNIQEYDAANLAFDEVVENAGMGRLNPSGFDDLGLLVAGYVLRGFEELLRKNLDPNGPEKQQDLPFDICVGVTPNDDFLRALNSSLLGPIVGTPGDVCVESFAIDVVDVDPPYEVTVDLEPGQDFIRAQVVADEVEITTKLRVSGYIPVVTVLGVGLRVPFSNFDVPGCTLDASAEGIGGAVRVALEPASDPHFVDAEQIADAAIQTEQIGVQFSGLCNFPGVNALLNGLAEPLEEVAESLVEGVVNRPGDPPNDDETLLSNALEKELEKEELPPFAFADGSGNELRIDATLAAITERPGFMLTRTDASFFPGGVHPLGLAQPFSFFDQEIEPVYGPTTPFGGLDYDVVAAVSTAALNQALRTAADLDTFVQVFDASNFAFTNFCLPMPPTTPPAQQCPATIAAFFTAWGWPVPANPVQFRIRPTLAPVVTALDEPLDPFPLNFHAAQHLVELVELPASGSPIVWLQAAVDVKVGLDVVPGPTLGTMVVGLTPFSKAGTTVLLQQRFSPLAWPPDSALERMGSLAVDDVLLAAAQRALSAVPLPSIGNHEEADGVELQIDLVESAVLNQHVSLFLDLEPN